LQSLSLGKVGSGAVDVCLSGDAIDHRATWDGDTLSITFGNRVHVGSGSQLKVSVTA
jgi:hypothetical protein